MLEVVTHQTVIDAILSPTAIIDASGRIVDVNAAWQSFTAQNGGDDRSYYVGRNYLEICDAAAGDGSPEARLVADGLRRVLGGQSAFRCEYPCHSPAEMRWFEVSMAPFRLPQRLVLVIHNDITRRRRAQEEVRRAQDNSSALAALVANSADAIISFGHDGTIQTWNAAATGLYGYDASEAIGQPIEILFPEIETKRFSEIRDRVIAGEMGRFEVVRRTKSGALRDVAISAAAVRDANGEVVSILGIHRDVTEDRATREHLAFITRELSHRSKNLLAIILSVQRQTARSAESLEDFHARFAARLKALEASLDLLVARGWERVSLTQLARSQLAVFAEPEDGRLSIDGPEVTLNTAAVEAIGMSLHELATNAMKHGALGPAGGSIRLSWTHDHSDAGRRLAIHWDESSPAISGPPQRTGFGHVVVTRVTRQKLGAEVSIDFQRGRLIWTAVVPQRHFSVPPQD